MSDNDNEGTFSNLLDPSSGPTADSLRSAIEEMKKAQLGIPTIRPERHPLPPIPSVLEGLAELRRGAVPPLYGLRWMLDNGIKLTVSEHAPEDSVIMLPRDPMQEFTPEERAAMEKIDDPGDRFVALGRILGARGQIIIGLKVAEKLGLKP